MNGKVCLAYIGINSIINKGSDILQTIDFKKLTHICIAFAGIEQTENIWLPYITDDAAAKIAEIKDEINIQKADTKILISVGGASQDGFCQAARTSENRNLFAAKVKEILNSAPSASSDTSANIKFQGGFLYRPYNLLHFYQLVKYLIVRREKI